jgi:hypothetical protein
MSVDIAMRRAQSLSFTLHADLRQRLIEQADREQVALGRMIRRAVEWELERCEMVAGQQKATGTTR